MQQTLESTLKCPAFLHKGLVTAGTPEVIQADVTKNFENRLSVSAGDERVKEKKSISKHKHFPLIQPKSQMCNTRFHYFNR